MKIEKNVVVSLAYQVKTEDGVVVDQSTAEAPLDYLHGHNNLITGLEKELDGKAVGEKFTATVAPEDAYGEHNDALVQRVPANVFQGVDEIEVGMRFMADTDQGPIPVEVTEVDGDEVVVDGNHMLAGQTLTFDVEVISTREATAEEIEHGHIHQEGGCCDDDHDHDHDHGEKDGCCGGGSCGSH
ncbi:FKBP-type peptidyl-prolyl cis-trans isomerase 2 [Vibrio nigripulchritudo ATCC 27043]|uniref:peptidylprolyl isomerase n=1 Tax=Vibrio nigripulchritudo TaxID=28173 RepID=UPI00021C29BC|nr:peptidylprolyl isomerase [Vibrio nigripulchritudo]EGU61013.1 FKBP-type peptidyl-prolyl cis-trans isomerase 2 [Vibrio nigripulchritudo ATCC 27043]